MAWSGGTYTKWNGVGGWVTDSLSYGIVPDRHDTQDTDFQNGINNCLTKDGQNTPTANLPMGGFKHTGAGAATANGQYITYDQVNDASPIKIDFTNDRLGLNTSTPAFTLDVNSTNNLGEAIARFDNSSGGAGLFFRKSRGAAIGTNTIVSTADTIGIISFQGANGTGYDSAATISCFIDGTPGASNDMPGGLIFSTTPDASATPAERMRITSAGNVGIGRTPTTNMLELGGQAAPTMSITSNSVSGVDMNFMSNGTTSARINVTSNHDLRFFTNNTFRVAVTATGSLTLNTAGTVIGGDFTNATVTSRNYLQTTTANSLTDVGVLPNGSSTVAGVSVLNNSTATNASYTSIGCNATDSIITAGRNGSGTYLPMTFYANGSERMRITTAGRVGIANNAPAGTLDVSNVEANNISTAKFVSTIAGDVAQNAVFIGKKDNNSTTSQILVQFAINSAATGSGQINANGASACAFGTFSDERLKENIENLPPQFSNIMALRPVEFDYKDGSGHQVGFIAQEVYPIYPDLIGTREDGMYTLTDLNKNDARLIKAFQELANMVTDLQTRVTALEGA